MLTGSPSGTSAAPATSFSLIVFTPVKAMSHRRVRGPSLTGMTSWMSCAHSVWRAGSTRHVSDDGRGCVGKGSPDGSYSHVSVDVFGSGSGTQRPGGPFGSQRARTIPIGPTSACRKPSFL